MQAKGRTFLRFINRAGLDACMTWGIAGDMCPMFVVEALLDRYYLSESLCLILVRIAFQGFTPSMRIQVVHGSLPTSRANSIQKIFILL